MCAENRRSSANEQIGDSKSNLREPKSQLANPATKNGHGNPGKEKKTQPEKRATATEKRHSVSKPDKKTLSNGQNTQATRKATRSKSSSPNPISKKHLHKNQD